MVGDIKIKGERKERDSKINKLLCYFLLFSPDIYLNRMGKKQQFRGHCHLLYNEWLCHPPEIF